MWCPIELAATTSQMCISVVIPCYNSAPYIERTVRSVIKQTHQDWKLIVVDDGSTDQSADIVKQFDDSRITLLQQQNRGVSFARNRGVEVADTEWVAFLDADDEWAPTFLQEVVSAISEYPQAVVIFTDYVVSPSGVVGLAHLPDIPVLVSDYFDFVLSNRRGMCSSCCVIKKSVLQRVGGFPVGVTHGEDTDTWVRLAWVGEFVCIPRPLSVYHTNIPDSATKIPLARRIGTPQPWITYCEWSRKGLIPKAKVRSTEKFMGSMMFRHALDLLDVGLKPQARAVLSDLEKIKMSPRLRRLLKVLVALPFRTGSKIWKAAVAIKQFLDRRGVRLRVPL